MVARHAVEERAIRIQRGARLLGDHLLDRGDLRLQLVGVLGELLGHFQGPSGEQEGEAQLAGVVVESHQMFDHFLA